MAESAFIELGSNIDPSIHLPKAVHRLAALGELHKLSRAYRSAAVGPPGQPAFANAAALLETTLDPLELRTRLKSIEFDLGRIRTANKFEPRLIDLDIILYGSLVLEGPPLQLPSPDLLERPYLAVIMAELNPSFLHPETGETLARIAGRLRNETLLEVDPALTRVLRRAQALLENGQNGV